MIGIVTSLRVVGLDVSNDATGGAIYGNNGLKNSVNNGKVSQSVGITHGVSGSWFADLRLKSLNQMVTNVLTPFYKLNQDGVSPTMYARYTSLTGRLSSPTLRSTLTHKNLTVQDLTT